MPRTLVSEDRCVLVSELDDGTATVAFRPDTAHVWGPPVLVRAPVMPSPAPPAPGAPDYRYWGD